MKQDILITNLLLAEEVGEGTEPSMLNAVEEGGDSSMFSRATSVSSCSLLMIYGLRNLLFIFLEIWS